MNRWMFVAAAIAAVTGCAFEVEPPPPEVEGAHEAIRNGTETVDPNTVEILGDGRTCSGYLLAPDIAITARHCLCEEGKANKAPLAPDAFTANARSQADLQPDSALVARFDWPESAGTRWADDVALLLLAEPLPFAGAHPMRLTHVEGTRQLMLTRGYGNNGTAGSEGTLRTGALVHLNTFRVDDTNFGDDRVDSIQFAAGTAPFVGVDTINCEGDSGGPIFFDNELYSIFAGYGFALGTKRPATPEGRCQVTDMVYGVPLFKHATWLNARIDQTTQTGLFPRAVPLQVDAGAFGGEVRVSFSLGQNAAIVGSNVRTAVFDDEVIAIEALPGPNLEFQAWSGAFCPCDPAQPICVFQRGLFDLGYQCTLETGLPIAPPPHLPPSE